MGRLIITDKPKPRLEIVEPRTRQRITPVEIVLGLGTACVLPTTFGGIPVPHPR
jgi:hypothetical protein